MPRRPWSNIPDEEVVAIALALDCDTPTELIACDRQVWEILRKRKLENEVFPDYVPSLGGDLYQMSLVEMAKEFNCSHQAVSRMLANAERSFRRECFKRHIDPKLFLPSS